MSLKRFCYFCGKPVTIRRQMSLFCSKRCEALYQALQRNGEPAPAGPTESPHSRP